MRPRNTDPTSPRYALTPRGETANRVLAVLVAIGCLGIGVFAMGTGGIAWAIVAAMVVVLAGIVLRYPPAYGALAFLALIGMTAGLRAGNVAVVIVDAGLVVLALFVRSQSLERVEPPPAPPGE
jgi:hypothetical protein